MVEVNLVPRRNEALDIVAGVIVVVHG
jgi:hypothetical protein